MVDQSRFKGHGLKVEPSLQQMPFLKRLKIEPNSKLSCHTGCLGAGPEDFPPADPQLVREAARLQRQSLCRTADLRTDGRGPRGQDGQRGQRRLPPGRRQRVPSRYGRYQVSRWVANFKQMT